MHFQCLQENLKRGLATVGHAVAGRSTLPVLSNILLKTQDGHLVLAANNLEIGITAIVGAKIDEDGAVTVPAKLLTDLVSNLPNDVVDIQLDDRTQSITVRCKGTKSVIKGIEADEFPAIPLADTSTAPLTVLSPDLFADVISQVAIATAQEHTNPVLGGMLIRFAGSKATFAAIDGYRLAVRSIDLEVPVETDIDLIIPGRALIELARTIKGTDEPISVYSTANNSQVIFHTETMSFVSRVIDGKFPDYERFIPQLSDTSTRTILNVADLTRAIKRMSLFATAAGNIVTLTMQDSCDDGTSGRLTLTATAAEVGDSIETVEGLIDGDGGKLALNIKYFQEAINAIDTTEVALESQSPGSPGVFKPVGGTDYLHLVMPMRIA